MSMMDESVVVCPKCGAEFTFRTWKSINTMLDPQMKEAVRDGSAFMAECPECGAKTLVDYEFQYHQMEDDLMIYYVHGQDSVDEICAMLSEQKEDDDIFTGLLKDHYTVRIVRSLNQFREKLAILDAGLDDRVVELCKLAFLGSVQQKTDTPMERTELLFDQGEGSDHSVVVLEDGKPTLTVNWIPALYDRFEYDFEDILRERENSEYIVDREWALKLFSEK